MRSFLFAVGIDVGLALTLLITIGFLCKFHKDVKRIKLYQNELQHFYNKFSNIIKQAHQNFQSLCHEKKVLSQDWDKRQEHVGRLLSDLEYATHRAEEVFKKFHSVKINKIEDTALRDIIPSYSEYPDTHKLHDVVALKRKKSLQKVLRTLG